MQTAGRIDREDPFFYDNHSSDYSDSYGSDSSYNPREEIKVSNNPIHRDRQRLGPSHSLQPNFDTPFKTPYRKQKTFV